MIFLTTDHDGGQRRRLDILRYLIEAEKQQAKPPSLGDIQRNLGVASTQTVRHHVSQLRASGLLARGTGLRALRLTEQGRVFASYLDAEIGPSP